MEITINDIKVKVRLLASDSSMLGQATVILFDIWEEHGWRIMISKKFHERFMEYLWIQPPAYPTKFGKNGWKEMVFVNDGRLYRALEDKIYDAYNLARTKEDSNLPPSEKPNTSADVEEKVDPDEIPF